MTVNEMHIAVNLGVQKLASFQVDNLLPEEIDHELNLAQLRFVKQRFNARSNRIGKGFEQTQKRIDDLKSLVVEHKGNTKFYGEVYTSNYSPVYVDRYTLPLDYLFLLSVRANIAYSCTLPPNQSFATTDYYFVKINLIPPVAGYTIQDIYYYNTDPSIARWVKATTTTLESFNKLISTSSYVDDVTPTLALPNNDSENLTVHVSPNIDSNHLYLGFKLPLGLNPGTGPGHNKCVYVTWVAPTGGTTSIVYYSDYTLLTTTKRSFVTNAAIPLYNKISYCKFAQHDDIYAILDDPFNRSNYLEPFYNIEESYLDIYTDNTFIADKAIIKYIKKPTAISKSLGIGSELPFHTHEEIVEMTVKSILEGFESQRYNTQSMETFESE